MKSVIEFRSDIPEGQSGLWKIEKFSVSKEEAEFDRLRSMISAGRFGRQVPEGVYTRLKRGGTVVMSDTPAELYDLGSFYRNASGDVLINGLGLGLAVQMALSKSEVKSVTVVEKSTDVISLVEPFLKDNRLRIIEGDCFEYKPERGRKFNAVWHDIWDYICSDNLDEMKTLHRRYGRRADWQGSWCRHLCERYA